MKDGMKVMALKAQNLRNVEIVEVQFDGKAWVEINGDNGAGKTTLIDTLFLAITGTKHVGRGFPGWRLVKAGADKALLKATIGNAERTIEIKRSIIVGEDGKTGGSLVATDQDGNRLGQEFLDGLLNEFTVDPMGFARKSAKDQAEIMRRLAGIDEEAFAARRAAAAEDRRAAGAKVKVLQARVGAEPPKVERADVGEILKARQKIELENDRKRKRNAEAIALDAAIKMKTVAIGGMDSEIAELEQTLADRRRERTNMVADLEHSQALREEHGEPEPMESTAAQDQAIQDAGATNARADARATWETNRHELDLALAEQAVAAGAVVQVETDRGAALAKSKLPFKNLTFDDEVGVMIGGVPFSQKSTAEQLRISSRIAMEFSPDLRVLCIREGDHLDEESYGVLRELADKHGYQVLLERVGEREGEDRVVLRAGRVISEFQPADKLAAARKTDML